MQRRTTAHEQRPHGGDQHADPKQPDSAAPHRQEYRHEWVHADLAAESGAAVLRFKRAHEVCLERIVECDPLAERHRPARHPADSQLRPEP
jgi:hypothetical protein